MGIWMRVVLTLFVGAGAGWLMQRRGVPAGILVGSILGVSTLNIFFESAMMPPDAKLIAQILTGAFLGCGITRQDIAHLPQVAKPFSLVVGSFFLLNLVIGLVIWKSTPLDAMTALLCALPGGISDTPLIAMDLGADAAKVAVMQFIRMVFGIAALPVLIVMIDKADPSQKSNTTPDRPISRPEKGRSPTAVLLTLVIATAGGLFGRWLGIAAGALVFSMFFSIFLQFTYPKAYLPISLRRLAQVISGCCIGSSILRSDLIELRYLIWPALLLMGGYLLNCVVVGKLMHRFFGMSLREGMLCASPAGATEMAFIAADMGVSSPNLIVLQICRLIAVMAVFPQVFTLLLKALGVS